VLENSFFVLENVKKSKKNKKIIFFYKIKKNIDFTIKFVIFNNFRPI